MSRTVADVVAEARSLLQDEEPEGYRYSDEQLVSYTAQAVAELARLRPDLLVGTGYTFPNYTTSDLDTQLPQGMDTLYFTHIVAFVVGISELREDQFAEDSRAVALLSRLRQAATVPGL